jgi:hypothetical protein
MATFRDLAKRAYRDIGVLGAVDPLEAWMETQALEAANALLDQWRAEKLMVPSRTRTIKALTASQASYTVGPAGNIAIARPMFIDGVGLILDSTADPVTEIPLGSFTEDAYRLLPQKALESTIPTGYYYNPTYASDQGTLSLWPVPTGSNLQIALYAWTAVIAFASAGVTVAVPPAYERMIAKQLALELAVPNGREVSRLLLRQAESAMAAVKRSNERAMELRFPSEALIGTGRRFNIYTGY